MKLLPIGSVVEIQGNTLCVIGYTSVQKESEIVCGYYMVPYPMGYVNVDKTFFIPHSFEMTVLATGYQTEDSQNILHVLGANFTIGEKYPTLDPNVIVQKYKQAIDKRKESGQ